MSKKVFLIVIFLVIQSFLPRSANASSLLFSDSFDDGRRPEWQESLGINGSWVVQDGYYRSTVLKSGPGDVPSKSVVGFDDWNDYDFRYKIYGEQGVDKVVYFKYGNNGDSFYEINLINGSPGAVFFCKKIVGVTKICPRYAQFNISSSQWYEVSILTSGTNIKVLINNNLLLDFDDPSPNLLTGKVALVAWPGAYCGNNCTTTVRFDGVEVVGEGTPILSPTPSPFPYFNQKDSPWGDDEYDHATGWKPQPPSDTTFSRWGCAVTSAAMVLRHHGVAKGPDGQTTDPETLNSWLNSQSDGYLGNGGVNWLALTRYAKLANNAYASQTKLKFLRTNSPDFASLDTDLAADHPPILEETNPSGNGSHFIVATEKQGSAYNINDPYFENYETLASYSNTFLGMRRFVPTNSDLSYLMATSVEDVTLSLVDSNGGLLSGALSYQELPIGSPTVNEVSGKTLNSVSLAQPENGIYQLIVTGPDMQTAQVTRYTYNIDGNVNIGDYHFLLEPGEEEAILINFDKSDVNSSAAIKKVTYESFSQDFLQAAEMDLVSESRIKMFSTLARVARSLHDQGHHTGEIAILGTLERSVEMFTEGEARTVLIEDVNALKLHT